MYMYAYTYIRIYIYTRLSDMIAANVKIAPYSTPSTKSIDIDREREREKERQRDRETQREQRPGLLAVAFSSTHPI